MDVVVQDGGHLTLLNMGAAAAGQEYDDVRLPRAANGFDYSASYGRGRRQLSGDLMVELLTDGEECRRESWIMRESDRSAYYG